MFLKEFPDYTWLKQQAEKAFREQLDVNGNKLAKEGWPIVIMNTKSAFCHRPDLKGPFSIFTNISGNSAVQVGSKKVTVSEDSFFITNRAQYYTLDIESDKPVETFNLHLGQDVWEDYTYTCSSSDSKLLDNPSYSQYLPFAEFPNLLQAKNKNISAALNQLYTLSQLPEHTKLQLDEHLVLLFRALTGQKQELQQAISRIPQTKQSTKTELHKRISLATDFILSDPAQQINLEDLASIACMSKFHFLRTFTSIYLTTPHQFILGQKLQRARRLLCKTRATVGEVALWCGFEELSVFSRTFKKYTGYTPQAYRALTN
ncbi:helix-turn-helix transcriptional regulator [Pontibacter sp. KCTC 32443]|uniref:helix-turn-helix transcriptional regulator n=1 Tax=Pontibacter TaxID=323449 RepID=UPI00164D9859|nr:MULTISPECIES: AraC family transcriptional regulator [Pontibacter]MBC5773579.1 helix-turn-helix transcriptional regulator [Pontibacter sp. KCTC 32443]